MEQRFYLESILKPILLLWVPEVPESWACTNESEVQASVVPVEMGQKDVG